MRGRATVGLSAGVVATLSLLVGCTGEVSTVSQGGELPPGAPAVPGPPGGGDMGRLPDGRMPGQADQGPGQVDMGVEPPRPRVPSGNALAQAMLFACDGQPSSSVGRLQRVGRLEWTRNVARGAGSDAAKNPFDPRAIHDFHTYSDDESLDETTLDIYLGTVGEASNVWLGSPRSRTVNDEASLHCFENDASPDDACVDGYVGYLLERGVLFRPPSAQEIAQLSDLAKQVLASESSPDDRDHTIKQVVSAAWMTSGALFRTELGQGEPDAQGRRKLGPWEIAQALSYTLDGRAPGALGAQTREGYSADKEGHLSEIASAARDGSISQTETIASLVRGMVGGVDTTRQEMWLDNDDSRRIERRGEFWIANGLRAFFREWLEYDKVESIFKDTPTATSAYEDDGIVSIGYGNLLSGFYGHESTLIEQMDDMIARVVAQDQDVFATLLTTRRFFVPATAGYSLKGQQKTNRIYGIDGDTPQSREARWAMLPADERAGVLTHPAFLAAHALNFENDPNPVHRGYWVRNHLLCESVPAVPITVDAAFDPDTRDQSTRQRLSEQVDARAECQACHDLMNPLGYPFEIYNHAGYLRAEDHGAAPSGTATLIKMPDPELEGPVRDAIEMSEKFAQSRYVKRCFIRHTFRYVAGRDETEGDACTLRAMEEAYDTHGGSMTEMLVAFFTSDTFLYRRAEEETP